MSKLWLESWTRPGHANFGRVRDYLPVRSAGARVGLNRVGDGNLELPDSFDGFDDILLTDRDTPANSRSSLIRLYSEEDPTTPIAEWLPSELFPSDDKNDPYTKVTGVGINGILGYARTEAWDWDGSDDWIPQFPDWVYGGPNIMGNPGFEESVCRPELEEIRISATGGTFILSFDGNNTAPIAYDANALDIETAIEAALLDDVLVSGTGRPGTYELEITATGGTFTITDGTDTTSAIAWNASAGTIETRLETDIAAIVDATVSGSGGSFTVVINDPGEGIALTLDGTSLTGGGATFTPTDYPDPMLFESVTPCAVAGGLLVISGGLTAGSVDVIRTQFGALQPNPWTKSQTVSRGVPKVFGAYDSFRVTAAEAHTGTWSLLIDPAAISGPAERFTGAQQLLNVTPGGLYQARIWIRPTSANDVFRFVIRGIDEDHVAGTVGGTAFTPNVWNEWVINDIDVGDRSQVIFRVANVNNPALGHPSNPSIFYLDDGEFKGGQEATTLGQILLDLYNDATVDHVADGRLVWEDDANPGNPYLTPDFTAAVDSNGNAWADAEISTRITMRFSYSQVMAWAVNEYGYEYRIVPDDPEAGTWLWQVYNPGTMDTAPDIAIQGGASDTRRQLRRQAPGGTDVLVEGLERVTSRARNAGLVTALGRIEASTLSREATGQSAVSSAAVAAAARELADIESVGYVFEGTLQSEPLSAYTIGDTVTIVDPPEIAALDLRCVDVEVSVTAKTVEWDAQFGALVLTNADAAIADAVAGLLQRFEYPETPPQSGGVMPGDGSGGVPTVFVAASDASDLSKEKADLLCTGVGDASWLTTANSMLAGTGGRIVLSEGNFYLDDRVTFGHTPGKDQVPVWVQGMGRGIRGRGTRLIVRFDPGTTFPALDGLGDTTFSDLRVLADFTDTTSGGYLIAGQCFRDAFIETVFGSAHRALLIRGGVTFGFATTVQNVVVLGDAATEQNVWLDDLTVLLGTFHGASQAGGNLTLQSAALSLDSVTGFDYRVNVLSALSNGATVAILDSSDGRISGGVQVGVIGPSADDTFDVMTVTTSDRVWFTDLVFRDLNSPANRYRHGINVISGNDNKIVDNDFGPSLFGTSPIGDTGTGTITTYPGGALGDNFGT